MKQIDLHSRFMCVFFLFSLRGCVNFDEIDFGTSSKSVNAN